MVNKLSTEEIKGRVVKNVLGINEPDFAILAKFKFDEFGNDGFNVEYFLHHKLNNVNYDNSDYNIIPDNDGYVFDSKKSLYIEDRSKGNVILRQIVHKNEDDTVSQLQFLYTIDDGNVKTKKVITFEDNGYFSYINSTYPSQVIPLSEMVANSTEQDGTLKNNLVYVLFSKQGINFYTEESPSENIFDTENFFKEEKEALRSFKIKVKNKGNFYTPQVMNITSLSQKIDHINLNSSMQKEDYTLDGNSNITEYKNGLFNVVREEGNIYKYYTTNDSDDNYIQSEVLLHIPFSGSYYDYLRDWVDLYEQGKKEKDGNEIAPGYLDSAIYNSTRDEVTYLLTINDVFKRSIEITRIDTEKNPTTGSYLGMFGYKYLFNVRYNDSNGLHFDIVFAYNYYDIRKVLPKFSYKCNDFSLSYDNDTETIMFFDSDYLTMADRNYIRFRDRYGIPLLKI